jgi:hypothetical protein
VLDVTILSYGAWSIWNQNLLKAKNNQSCWYLYLKKLPPSFKVLCTLSMGTERHKLSNQSVFKCKLYMINIIHTHHFENQIKDKMGGTYNMHDNMFMEGFLSLLYGTVPSGTKKHGI